VGGSTQQEQLPDGQQLSDEKDDLSITATGQLANAAGEGRLQGFER
jgi:hypothetical protein